MSNGAALIYSVTNGPIAVLANGTVPGGAIIRRYGPVSQTASGVVVYESGYYDIDLNITLEPVAAGNITVTLLDNGVEIPGATALALGAPTVPVQFAIPAMIRTYRCGEPHNITVVLSAAATVTNSALRVERVRVNA